MNEQRKADWIGSLYILPYLIVLGGIVVACLHVAFAPANRREETVLLYIYLFYVGAVACGLLRELAARWFDRHKNLPSH